MNAFVILERWSRNCFGLVLAIAFGSAIGLGGAPAARGADAANEAFAERPAPPYLALMLVRDPAVHRELKLSRQQGQRIAAAVEEVDNDFWRLRDLPTAKSGEDLERLFRVLRKRMKESLSDKQRARFEQILLQARGHKALASTDVADYLKLTTDQRDAIRRTLIATTRTPASDAKEKGSSKGSSKKSASQQVFDHLTPEQVTRWNTLVGASFNFDRVRQIGCVAPELRGVEAWINSDPLTLEDQRGKVVALHFWAYGCINCVRNLPHYQGWHESFPESDLTIIGIHTPETEPEKQVENLKKNIAERGIKYPVAFDAKSENWKAWGNHMWPSVYLIDKRGQVRYWWYGELNWQGATGEEFMRKKIAQLLAEK